MREPAVALALLPIRLFCGWVFLRAALAKIAGGWLERPVLVQVLDTWIREGRPYGFFASFLKSTVIPHERVFSWLVAGGELLVGAALLAGLFTRFTAACGLLLTLSYMLGRGDGAEVNSTAPFVVRTLALMFTHSGRTLGLDAALAHRVPRWLT
jgi:thiosulfate dehydrogenase [quinone] large subunit